MIENIFTQARSLDLTKNNLELESLDNEPFIAMLNSEIYNRLKAANEIGSLEDKSNILLALKDFLISFRSKNSSTISTLLEDQIFELSLELCTYSDFYKGLFWLKKVSSAGNPETFLGFLYTCVDFLEGAVYRITQLHRLKKEYKLPQNMKIVFWEIFDYALIEYEKIKESENIHHNQVAIRRTAISGIAQLQAIESVDLITKNRQDQVSWEQEEATLDLLIDLVDDWSQQEYTQAEKDAYEEVMSALQKE